MWRNLVEKIHSGIGVRPRLSLLTLAAIGPLFALLFIGLLTDREFAIRSARTHAGDLAQLIAERQAAASQSAIDVLSVLRKTPDIADFPSACHATLQAIVKDHPDFYTIGVVGPDGAIVCHNIRTEPKTFVGMDFFHEVLKRDPSSFSMSTFRMSTIARKPTILVGTPFQGEGKSPAGPGIIYVSLNLDLFEQVARQFTGSEDWSVMVVETMTDTVIAQTPHEAGSLIGKSFSDHPLTKAMREHPQGGRFDIADFDGVPRIYGLAPLPFGNDSHLMVAVGIPSSVVLAEANNRMMIGLTIALVAAACAACAAWFLGDLWQLSPIKALVDAARRVGKGDLTTPVEIAAWHAPEFRDLGSTLNEMAKNIAAFQKLVTEQEAQFRLLVENSTDVVFQLDLNLVRQYLSPASLEILGFKPEELQGTTSNEMIHPDDRAGVLAVFQPLIAGEMERASIIYRIGHRDGHWVWVHSELRLLRDPQTKQPIGISGAKRDISSLKAAEEAVRQSEARYRLLADNVADLIICLDLDLKPTYVSPASRHLLGCDPEELTAGTLEGFTLATDRAFLRTALLFMQKKEQMDDFRFRVQHLDGRIRWLEMSGRKPAGGDTIILALHDITTRQLAESRLEEANNQLRNIAGQDFLTGLANRRVLEDLLDREFRRAARTKTSLAMIMIDVDRFKAYNDVYGHLAGDACLKKITQVVKNVVQRPGDLAARFGGEEIAILLPNTDERGAFAVAERIRSMISEMQVAHKEGINQTVTISAGVAAVVPGVDAQTKADLVSAADQALYSVKAAGRNAVSLASQHAVTALLYPRRIGA